MVAGDLIGMGMKMLERVSEVGASSGTEVVITDASREEVSFIKKKEVQSRRQARRYGSPPPKSSGRERLSLSSSTLRLAFLPNFDTCLLRRFVSHRDDRPKPMNVLWVCLRRPPRYIILDVMLFMLLSIHERVMHGAGELKVGITECIWTML